MGKAKDTVYPTGARDMPGVPAVAIITDEKTAKRLVASGAFTFDAPSTGDFEPIELTADQAAALDTFVGG